MKLCNMMIIGDLLEVFLKSELKLNGKQQLEVREVTPAGGFSHERRMGERPVHAN